MKADKKKVAVIAAVIVIVLLAICFVVLGGKKGNAGYYNGDPWGMSYSDFSKKHPEAIPGGKENAYLIKGGQLADVPEVNEKLGQLTTIYYFDQNELKSVQVLLMLAGDTSSKCRSAIIEKYTTLYGEASGEEGNSAYTSIYWNTDKTDITVNVLDSVVLIDFTEKGYTVD